MQGVVVDVGVDGMRKFLFLWLVEVFLFVGYKMFDCCYDVFVLDFFYCFGVSNVLKVGVCIKVFLVVIICWYFVQWFYVRFK